MRNLVLVLLALFAAVTFIRAFDHGGPLKADFYRAMQVRSLYSGETEQDREVKNR